MCQGRYIRSKTKSGKAGEPSDLRDTQHPQSRPSGRFEMIKGNPCGNCTQPCLIRKQQLLLSKPYSCCMQTHYAVTKKVNLPGCPWSEKQIVEYLPTVNVREGVLADLEPLNVNGPNVIRWV